MIQFFKLSLEASSASEYSVLTGSAAVKFFIRRILYIILFVYSTLFLAAAFPFVATPCYPIYLIGGFASAIYIIRSINLSVLYAKYRGGFISVDAEGIKIRKRLLLETIPKEEIKYIEHNALGNLVVRGKQSSVSFPLGLLSEKDKKALLSEFVDMAPKRSLLFKKAFDMAEAVAVALVLAVHIIQYIIQAYHIPSQSMTDTLLVGDYLFVEKITYGPTIPQMAFMDKPVHLKKLALRDVKRQDIVIFRPPHEEDKDYIKRCIAVPGDTVEFKNGFVYLNGERQDEPYTGGKETLPGYVNIEGVVPEGKLVVLGDNRTDSQDSRYFGYLDINRIKGRALVLYWNSEYIFKRHDFSRFGLIK